MKGVHVDVCDKTTYYFHFFGGGLNKNIWISLFIPHVTFGWSLKQFMWLTYSSHITSWTLMVVGIS